MERTIQKIFGYLVIGPHVFLWLIDPILEKIIPGLNVSDAPNFGYALIGLSILGDVLVIFKKWQTKTSGVGWYAIAGVTIIANVFWLYFVVSLAHFGF